AVIALVRRGIERAFVARLRRRLASPRCIRRRAPDWGTALAGVAGARARLAVARATPPVPGAGDYCFRDVVSKLDPIFGNSGPPEWQTILPVDTRSVGDSQQNGQRRRNPDRPLDAPGNHAVSWDEVVHPEPEYGLLLAYDTAHEDPEQGFGNFSVELQGSLENEVEQWLVPVGYRPEPGDRIHLVGRWVIDCGHEDWHAELHPIEAFV